ncbi:D-methionine transport system permease protein [Succinivibrio dextrinosolvens DSM 3072]|jgi:D-methionine transport system permease protein|uniref:D-methionine transport system permease protein n=1 Tax=Succinivibrio dextrinosolvens DSM 3072 TaxID=1123324 RepID=A0A1T4UY92_9GAMM|nr:D-methionine transport system permease protein [Succinivibrio dextrinosolvens DSM 3072]
MSSQLLESTINILQNEFLKSIYETALMIGISFSLSLIFGLALGFVLYLTSGKTFFEKTISLNKTVSAFINIIRSIPFIILVVFSLPLTFILVGTKIGPIAASVPLSIAAIVFFARLVESALKEVDAGVIEAAIATGASHSLIIRNVLLVEAAPAIVRGITITFINLIGCSAMAGMVGGGGIGNLAIQYGYYRYETGVMIFTIVVLVVIVQLAQLTGDRIAKLLTH